MHSKYSGSYEEIVQTIRHIVPTWVIETENGYHLAPAYDLLNTSLHVNGADFGLDGGLLINIEKSDVFDQTEHPCRLDFERLGAKIGLVGKRMRRILDRYMELPEGAKRLIFNSFLTEKMRRDYFRIVNERIRRFVRHSE